MNEKTEEERPDSIHVVLNWIEAMNRDRSSQ